MDDEEDFFAEAVEFGDGTKYTVEPQAEPAPAPTPPRGKRAASPVHPNGSVTASSSASVATPSPLVSPREPLQKPLSTQPPPRTLFNEHSNKLEPYSGPSRGPPPPRGPGGGGGGGPYRRDSRDDNGGSHPHPQRSPLQRSPMQLLQKPHAMSPPPPPITAGRSEAVVSPTHEQRGRRGSAVPTREALPHMGRGPSSGPQNGAPLQMHSPQREREHDRESLHSATSPIKTTFSPVKPTFSPSKPTFSPVAPAVAAPVLAPAPTPIPVPEPVVPVAPAAPEPPKAPVATPEEQEELIKAYRADAAERARKRREEAEAEREREKERARKKAAELEERFEAQRKAKVR